MLKNSNLTNYNRFACVFVNNSKYKSSWDIYECLIPTEIAICLSNASMRNPFSVTKITEKGKSTVNAASEKVIIIFIFNVSISPLILMTPISYYNRILHSQ